MAVGPFSWPSSPRRRFAPPEPHLPQCVGEQPRAVLQIQLLGGFVRGGKVVLARLGKGDALPLAIRRELKDPHALGMLGEVEGDARVGVLAQAVGLLVRRGVLLARIALGLKEEQVLLPRAQRHEAEPARAHAAPHTSRTSLN